ncbi:hypothetical protein PUN28_011051 [Cardiocondyla obscurior]|uniref:Uncharacterized protein n=1 Tax=Cardiocondyla obscurior TaxID=286306 RepID=A0AAW2FP47_9HYME
MQRTSVNFSTKLRRANVCLIVQVYYYEMKLIPAYLLYKINRFICANKMMAFSCKRLFELTSELSRMKYSE